MRLLWEMFGLTEAGVENEPTGPEPKKARRKFASDVAPPDDDVPEFGETEPEDEEEPEFGQSEPEPEEPEADPGDDLDPRNDKKFASEPQRPKAAPPAPGLQLSGDPGTLAQLRDALDQLSSSPRVDEDLAEWLDECVRAIDQAGRRKEQTVSLPRFTATPDLDDFDDDGSDEEEGEYEDG